MFSSLKVKHFRIYWLGMFVSLVGTWIQTVAQSWLVFQLTNSAFLLPIIGLIFVIESLSVIIQLFWRKFFHQKLFHPPCLIREMFLLQMILAEALANPKT